MSDNKNELEYNDIEEIEDLNDAVDDINGQKENNEDKKSNITENRYEDTEKKDNQNNEDNISEIYKNNKTKIENNQSTINFQDQEQKNENNNNQMSNEQENILSSNNNNNTNNISYMNNNRNFDSKLHVRNPVPLSKLQIAENKYYQIKAEIEEKFFNVNLDNVDSSENSKYTQEMISYLEKLNDVLTQIISNTKIKEQRSNRNKSPSQTKDPDLLYQEQQKLNDNSEKLIEVYKKQLLNLQNRLDIVSNPDYLPNLKYENEQLDREIYDLQIENKKLRNTEKLNDIVISKQNKGENKSAIILKRLKMDYDNVRRQNANFLQKVEKNKFQEEENEKKINQLNEWVEKLRNIAKDTYNITEYENVKTEEQNEKKLTNKKNTLIKNIEILQKVKNTNQKKYELEISNNEKTINELQETKKNLELKLQNEKENFPQYENIQIAQNKNTKKKKNNIPESTVEEREEIMKEIEKVQKQKEEMMNIINQNENNIDDNNNKKGQKPFIKPFKDLQRQNSKNDISNINPMIENSNFGLNGENENRSLLNNTKENEPFLEKDEIEGNEEENEKDDNNEYMENEEKENKDEENNEEKNVIVNKENSDVPKFLEGFDDNEKDVEIIKKDNEKDDDTNEVIKERKNKMEILQKESMKNILEEKKKKEEEEEIKKKLPPNEFEDIEEFQI